jgi:cell division septal protein FtsQ
MNDIRRVPLTPARKKRRRRKKIIRALLVIFLVLFFIAAFIFAFRIPQILITTVSVEGNTGIQTADIQKIANRDLSGFYYFLFPKNNILIYSKQQIIRDIRTTFTQAGTISVSDSSLDSITIAISERKPNDLWCDSTSTSTCYFMDKTGYIFSLAPTVTGSVYLKYFGGFEGNPIDKQFIPTDKIAALDAFAVSVKNLGLVPQSITIMSYNEYRMQIAGNGVIFFNNETPFDAELSNLAVLLQQKDFTPLATGGIPQFEYIDLRYGNKLIYKIGVAGNGASPDQIEASSTLNDATSTPLQ